MLDLSHVIIRGQGANKNGVSFIDSNANYFLFLDCRRMLSVIRDGMICNIELLAKPFKQEVG